jgi:Sulfotransferase family
MVVSELNPLVPTRPGGRRVKPVCYSASLNYVFIHIPKCAGTSIHRALTSLHAADGLPIEKPRYHKHSKAFQVRKVLSRREWNNTFKFSFVRNPWDLMVSSYHWWITHAYEFTSLAADIARIKAMGNFSAFIRSKYGLEMINEHYGKDELDWVSHKGRIIVDFIGRYEHLAEDWAKVCEALGVAKIELGRENRVARENYRAFYDEETNRLVTDRFARTIELFGYEF